MKAIVVMVLAGVAATALACSESPTSPSAPIAGTYVLATVNGESLPAVVTISVDTTVIVTDTLALSSHLTYTRHVLDTLREEGSAPTVYSHASSGRFAYTGTSITLTDGASGVTATGTIAGGVLTLTTVEAGFAIEEADPANIKLTGVFNKE